MGLQFQRHQLRKDKNFQQVQKQLADAKNSPERQAALEAMGNIVEGTVSGKVFQDRQALMGLYAYRQERQRVDQIAEDSMTDYGVQAHHRNYEFRSSRPGFKVDQAKNEAEFAQQAAMDKFTPAIGAFADGLTGLMRDFPLTSVAAVGAATALTALAGAAGVATAATLLNRGPGGLPGALPGAAAEVGAASKAMGFIGTMGKLLGPLMMLEALTQPSDEDIAKLRARDARNAQDKRQSEMPLTMLERMMHAWGPPGPES